MFRFGDGVSPSPLWPRPFSCIGQQLRRPSEASNSGGLRLSVTYRCPVLVPRRTSRRFRGHEYIPDRPSSRKAAPGSSRMQGWRLVVWLANPVFRLGTERPSFCDPRLPREVTADDLPDDLERPSASSLVHKVGFGADAVQRRQKADGFSDFLLDEGLEDNGVGKRVKLRLTVKHAIGLQAALAAAGEGRG